MLVNIRLQGGQSGLLDVLEGLVVRNERAIRCGGLPASLPRMRVQEDRLWRDGPSAKKAGLGSSGTLAAWEAAAQRVRGAPSIVAMVGGIPRAIDPTKIAGPGQRLAAGTHVGNLVSNPSSVPLHLPARSPALDGPGNIVRLIGGDAPFPTRNLDMRYGAAAFADPLGMAMSPGVVDANGNLITPSAYRGHHPTPTAEREGMSYWGPDQLTPFPNVSPIGLCGSLEAQKHLVTGSDRTPVSEWMLLELDDDDAMPIREIGNTIAKHNAYQIIERGLKPIYQSHVRYQTEGAPEIWKDVATIYEDGHDDCEGFAAVRAAELMIEGFPAEVWTRQIKLASNPNFTGSSGAARMFHAVTRVKMPDGTYQFDDPSVRLGMPVPESYLEYAAQQRAAGRTL